MPKEGLWGTLSGLSAIPNLIKYAKTTISDVFSLLGFDIQTNSDHKSQRIKLCSVSALNHYLNEKNLIHFRVMAMISKFSPQIFETYCKYVCNGH